MIKRKTHRISFRTTKTIYDELKKFIEKNPEETPTHVVNYAIQHFLKTNSLKQQFLSREKEVC